jgi:hypothetical protein
VVRENQRVHFGKTELEDEDATLADLNVLPGAHLWVMDTGQHENRDITGWGTLIRNQLLQGILLLLILLQFCNASQSFQDS